LDPKQKTDVFWLDRKYAVAVLFLISLTSCPKIAKITIVVVNRSIRGIELSDGSHCRLKFPETDTISSHSLFLLCPLKTRE